MHICSRKKQNVEDAVAKMVKQGLTVHGHICNVGKPADRKVMLEKIQEMHGRLDVLVPNAACSTHFGDQLDIKESQYNKLWDLNVKSTFFLIKEAKPMLVASAE